MPTNTCIVQTGNLLMQHYFLYMFMLLKLQHFTHRAFWSRKPRVYSVFNNTQYYDAEPYVISYVCYSFSFSKNMWCVSPESKNYFGKYYLKVNPYLKTAACDIRNRITPTRPDNWHSLHSGCSEDIEDLTWVLITYRFYETSLL